MSDKQDTREMLVSGNVFKTMLTLSVPAVLGMVVIGLYNFMDAVFVGQMVGPVAMTAVKVSYPFTLINSGIATLIGQGSASVLSPASGPCRIYHYRAFMPAKFCRHTKAIIYGQRALSCYLQIPSLLIILI